MYKLNNGLKVYLNRVEGKKVISCGIWINQGSKDENFNNNGLSHFVEHMMFRIKCKESKYNMDTHLNELRNKGAFYNATTSKDNTSFYIEGLASDYRTFLKILSYIVTNKEKVSEDELEKEKEVVLREAESHFMSISQMSDRIGQALWGNRYYGNPVIGNCHNIKKFTCNMVNKFIEEHYTPDNSCLVVTGDFEFSEIKEVIEMYFSKWMGRCCNKKNYCVKADPHILIDDRFNGSRSTVGIGFRGYAVTDIKSLYLELLKDVLINPDYRLFEKLRSESGLLYSLRGYANAFSNSGNMGLVFSSDNDFIRDIVEILMEECRNIVTYGIDDKTFESLKRKKLVQSLFEFESSTVLLETIGKAAANGYIFSLEKYISDIESLSRDKMQEVIKEVLLDGNICMAVLGCADITEIKPLLIKGGELYEERISIESVRR